MKVPGHLAPLIDDQAHMPLVHGHARIAHHHHERLRLLLFRFPQALHEEIHLTVPSTQRMVPVSSPTVISAILCGIKREDGECRVRVRVRVV